MPARGRPPKRNGKGSGNAGGSSSGGGRKANGGSSASGGITHRARDKTRGQGARVSEYLPGILAGYNLQS